MTGDERFVRPSALGVTSPAAVRCPWCAAGPWQTCTRPSFGGPKHRSTPHPSRIDAVANMPRQRTEPPR